MTWVLELGTSCLGKWGGGGGGKERGMEATAKVKKSSLSAEIAWQAFRIDACPSHFNECEKVRVAVRGSATKCGSYQC
ncbi:uncharacterized protein DS421_11g321680 [Arachis hypogaea]|nr:uncharacterized protein DS421_11g321680 [Arachis hypogaea]